MALRAKTRATKQARPSRQYAAAFGDRIGLSIVILAWIDRAKAGEHDAGYEADDKPAHEKRGDPRGNGHGVALANAKASSARSLSRSAMASVKRRNSVCASVSPVRVAGFFTSDDFG